MRWRWIPRDLDLKKTHLSPGLQVFHSSSSIPFTATIKCMQEDGWKCSIGLSWHKQEKKTSEDSYQTTLFAFVEYLSAIHFFFLYGAHFHSMVPKKWWGELCPAGSFKYWPAYGEYQSNTGQNVCSNSVQLLFCGFATTANTKQSQVNIWITSLLHYNFAFNDTNTYKTWVGGQMEWLEENKKSWHKLSQNNT